MGVVFAGGWCGPLAVYQVEWVARERVGGVEDVARPLARFAAFDAVNVVSPCAVGVKGSGFGYVVG